MTRDPLVLVSNGFPCKSFNSRGSLSKLCLPQRAPSIWYATSRENFGSGYRKARSSCIPLFRYPPVSSCQKPLSTFLEPFAFVVVLPLELPLVFQSPPSVCLKSLPFFHYRKPSPLGFWSPFLRVGGPLVHKLGVRTSSSGGFVGDVVTVNCGV